MMESEDGSEQAAAFAIDKDLGVIAVAS